MYYCELRDFTEKDRNLIQRIFQDPNGWRSMGVNIEVVDDISGLPKSKKNFILSNTQGSLMNAMFPRTNLNGLSVTDRTSIPYKIFIRRENWTSLPSRSEYKTLNDYRIAIINHEVAHVLGYKHVSCKGPGYLSDVRQQPTLSLGGCKPTTSVVLYNDLKEWL